MAELTLIQGNEQIVALGGSGDVFVGADNTGLLNKQFVSQILSGKGTFIAGQCTIIDANITTNSWITTGLMIYLYYHVNMYRIFIHIIIFLWFLEKSSDCYIKLKYRFR